MIDPKFRVLYREFLFRMVDLEALSADALGDANRLLGRFAALLVTLSVVLAVHALEMAGSNTPAALRFFDALRFEHFLIATTMLVVGLFAVLSWDSTFPDRRDVLVLAPLPVRARTLFLAKASAVATALALAIVLLHGAAGLVWPLALGVPAPVRFPALTRLPAVPPGDPDSLEPLLNRDLSPALAHDLGVSIGVARHGRRRIFSYGTAHPNALAGARGICSTAGDTLTLLEAQLRPGSPPVRLSPKATGLTWMYNANTGTYWRNADISGCTSYSFFNPGGGYAAVVLVNHDSSFVSFAEFVAQYIRQRLAGEPAISLAAVTVPPSDGVWGTIRIFLAYWTVMLGAGAFVLCCVLGLQGLAAQTLPRRLFLRLSSFLQLACFGIIVCGYFLQPLIPTLPALVSASGHEPLAWSPSYWFLGLFQQLSGSPALAPLAHRAWISLAATIGGAAVAYALCYSRTLRKIVEEPDIVSGARGGVWLPRFGGAIDTAIVQFSVRTLLRSRLHRLILTFYWGMGFAYTVFLLRLAPARLTGAPAGNGWGQINPLLLVASVVMMAFSALGTRVVFAIPLDLRANWIFRLTGVRRAPECLSAGRRAQLLLAAAPVWALSAACCFWSLPWRAAPGHLALLALFALVSAELCLYRFDKIPFTCSYLPGKSQLHLAVLGVGYMLWVIGLDSKEFQVLEDPAGLAGLLLALVFVWACARWRNTAHAKSEDAEVQFEAVEAPAVQGLGLTRDGSWPIDPPSNR